MSEPTGSLTRWDGEFDRPFITVCPYHAFDRELRQIIECGTDEEKQQLFENYTLLELFKTEGLALDKMFQEYYWDDYNSSRENLPDENGVWFLNVNYAHGGLCATFNMEKDYETVFILSRWPDYEQNKTDYYSNNSCSRDDDCNSQYYYAQYYDSQTDSFTETSDGSSSYEDVDRQYEIKSENLMSASHSSPNKRLPLAASNPHRMQVRQILKDDNAATEWESQDFTRHERAYARLQSYFHDRFEASEHPDTTEGTQEPGVLAGSYAAFDETRVNRFVTPIGKKIVVENPGIAYRIHIHGMDDFWGAEDKELTSSSDAEMATFALLTSFSNQELVVHVDREVMPNLRRQPCEEDPSYSRNRCWRKCFMDWLDCSIDGGDDKPTCAAYVFECFEDIYMAFAEYASENLAENIPSCSCPQPCIKHRYSIYVRPGEHDSTDTWFYIPVTFRPVQRTRVVLDSNFSG